MNILILILIILSLIEILPYIITVLYPNACYGCSKIGKLHQKLNNKYKLAYICWFSYLLLFCYFIYLSLFLKNNTIKYILILLLLVLIYLPLLPILNIITIILSIVYNNPPFINNYHDIFPDSIYIEKNAERIIEEYNTYTDNNLPECIRKSIPGFTIENTSDNNSCWRILYLKRGGKIDKNMIKYFPITISLLESKQIHSAFFSILDSGVEISPHVGYYKGYLRYHLGIIIPNNKSIDQDNKAYIVCGNEKYIWKEKEGIVFDDMYLHYVKNPTNQLRVVLYLDIKRINDNNIINEINNIGINLIKNSFLFNIFIKNQHSQNKI